MWLFDSTLIYMFLQAGHARCAECTQWLTDIVKTLVRALLMFLALAGMGPRANDTEDVLRTIRIVNRHLYGPGPFPDQQLQVGHIKFMKFVGFMRATVAGFNNGADEPNVSGEALVGKNVNGRMSDGTLLNEHIDMGNAAIMNGRFNLLLGAVFGGPSDGASLFFLDDDYNWTIKDDIAIDPGFPEGIIKMHDFVFGTGPRFIPYSMQTESGDPGGVDIVGSLKAGDLVLGRVGDDDFDGFVDGVFNAVGRFPLDSVLLPGAPFVQRFQFVSDIPIRPTEAAVLTIASGRNALRQYVFLTKNGATATETHNSLLRQFRGRVDMAIAQLRRARQAEDSCALQCDRVEPIVGDLRTTLNDVAHARVDAALATLDHMIFEMRGHRSDHNARPTKH